MSCPFQFPFAHVQVKADGLRQTKGRLKMKTNLTRTLILTAFALTGAAVYGQDKIAVDVPFAFRAAGQEFDAGTYYVSQSGHSVGGILMLLNQDSRRTKFVTTAAPGDSKDASPKLVFRCGDESGCALSAVQLANGRSWKLRTPHLKPSEMERIAVIYFDRKQAE
jgi:hypothetical protein